VSLQSAALYGYIGFDVYVHVSVHADICLSNANVANSDGWGLSFDVLPSLVISPVIWMRDHCVWKVNVWAYDMFSFKCCWDVLSKAESLE